MINDVGCDIETITYCSNHRIRMEWIWEFNRSSISATVRGRERAKRFRNSTDSQRENTFHYDCHWIRRIRQMRVDVFLFFHFSYSGPVRTNASFERLLRQLWYQFQNSMWLCGLARSERRSNLVMDVDESSWSLLAETRHGTLPLWNVEYTWTKHWLNSVAIVFTKMQDSDDGSQMTDCHWSFSQWRISSKVMGMSLEGNWHRSGSIWIYQTNCNFVIPCWMELFDWNVWWWNNGMESKNGKMRILYIKFCVVRKESGQLSFPSKPVVLL